MSNAIETQQLAITEAQTMSFAKQFHVFRIEVSGAVQDLAGASDRFGSGSFLVGLGAAILVLALFWKLSPFGIQVSELQPSEFITVAILAAFLMAGGSAIRLYQLHLRYVASADIRSTGEKLLERAHETTVKLATHIDDGYKA